MTRGVLLVVLLGFANISCGSLSMDRMILAFDTAVQKTLGRHIDELKHSETQAFIGKRVPMEIRVLENGNTLHVYDYWKDTAMKRNGECHVFLEFNTETMIVVKASSAGKGCYTAY